MDAFWLIARLLGWGWSGASPPSAPGKVAGVWRCVAGLRAWSCPAGLRVWRASPVSVFAGIVTKAPGDRVWLVFDFGDLPELAAGAEIDSVSVPAVSGITISGVALVGTFRVGAWYESGTAGVDYSVTCSVTLDDTTVVARTGTLRVKATD